MQAASLLAAPPEWTRRSWNRMYGYQRRKGGVVREGRRQGRSEPAKLEEPPLLFYVVPMIDLEMRNNLNLNGSPV